MPALPFPPVKYLVDDEVLDALTRVACFAADDAAIDASGRVSKVRRPDGGPQGLTGAELTEVVVRAGIRCLIANSLITHGTVDEIHEILANGVSIH